MLFDGLHQNPSSESSLQSGILIKLFISMTPIRCHLPWIFQIQTLPHGFPDGLLVVCSPSLPPSINAILLIPFKFWLTRNDKVPFWSLSHMSNILLRLCNSFYSDARDSVLRSHPFNFSITRTTLAQFWWFQIAHFSVLLFVGFCDYNHKKYN